MKNLSVLIVDDSVSFSSGLKRIFESIGWIAQTAENMETATSLFQSDFFDLAIIDCFIPGADGFSIVNTLNELNQNAHQGTTFFLMSGILVDQASKKEALQSPYVKHFITKPIDTNALKKNLDKFFPPNQTSPIKIFMDSGLSPEQVTAELKKIDKIQNYEAPFVLKKLSDCEFSGDLKFSKDSVESVVSFNNGEVTSVFNSNFEDSIGELLVGGGLLTRENLSFYISSEDFKSKSLKIGDALIKANFVSPHAVPLTLRVQKKLRIKKILFEESTFHFSIEEKPYQDTESDANLNIHELEQSLIKLISDFPKEYFNTRLEKSLSEFKFQSAPPLPTKSKEITEQNLQSLIKKQKAKSRLNPEEIQMTVQLLLQKRLELALIDSQNSQNTNQKNLLNEKIKYLAQKVKLKNPYEILDLSTDNISDQKVSKKYQSIAKELHPDKLSKVLNPEDQKEAMRVFAEFTKAFNNIKTAENRQTYESFKANQIAQNQMDCNKALEEAKKSLHSGKYTRALCLLNTEAMHQTKPNEFGLYFLWAAFKNTDYVLSESPTKVLEEEHKNLKNAPLYYYLKALNALKSEDLEGFSKFINLSLKADPHFLPARREFQIVRSQKTKPKEAEKPKKSSWFSFKKSS